MQDIKYMPYLETYKAPVGALKVCEEAKINLYINSSFNISRLKLVILNDSDEVEVVNYLEYFKTVDEEIEYNIYTTTFSINKPYIYFYYFEFMDCYGTHFIIPNEMLEGYLSDSLTKMFQVNVSDATTSNFSWYQGKVMYQIMLDRFNRSKDINKLDMSYKHNYYLHQDFNEHVLDEPYNGDYHVDFFGGDINGLRCKLDYLKELNVGVIYLNPIFLSPTSHKYNTSDYLMIDPMYGTIDDFRSLIKEAKEKGIYIILDGVYNHTGDDSIYFNKYHHFSSIGAYESKDSKYYKWYDFFAYPDSYRSWWGINTLPSVNQNSGFIDFITGDGGVIDVWMREGIKGMRLDVVDEINDSFVTKINKIIKQNDNDAIIIGEVWEDATNKISYDNRRNYFNGHELDSVMNYCLRNGIIDYLRNNNIYSLIKEVRNIINNYDKKYRNLLMNILSTHDTYRIITMLSKVDENKVDNKLTFTMDKGLFKETIKKLKLAFVITYTMPGIPCIYYGDEIAMEGFRDPYSRESMKWDKTTNNKLLEFLKQLGNIRLDPLFIDGDYKEEYYDNNHYVYSRINDQSKITIIINNSNDKYSYNIKGINLITNKKITKSITINSYDFAIIKDCFKDY